MSLKTKIFAGFSISVLILFSLFSLYTFNETTNTIVEKEEEQLATLSQSIKAQMEGQLSISEVSALSLANNKEVERLFAERDRGALLDMLLPAYESISEDVAQIQFHLPDSTSFLRLHKPEKFGDSLKEFRFTVNQANEDKKTIRGLEEGVAGFGFRVVVPMSYNGRHTGTVEYGSDFGQAFLDSIKSSYEGEYLIYQFGKEEAIASTASEDVWSIDLDTHMESLKSGETLYLETADGDNNVTLAPFSDYQGDVVGYFKIVNDRTALVKDLNDIKRNSLILTIGILGVVLLLFYLFLNYSFKPIFGLMESTRKVAEGDLTQVIEIKSKDEIGELAASFNAMISSLRTVIARSSDVSEQVAATSQELSAAAQEVTASSEQVSNTIFQVADAANTQTSSIRQSSADIDQMIEDIDQANVNINLIDDATRNTLESAEKGIISSKHAVDKINSLKTSTEKTSDDINKLNDSSKEIEAIVSTIGKIAEQTNLLALNAAIEAARAGEAGRGFSVVAEEVKKLADETTQSSHQISDLIVNIQKQIEFAVYSMKMNIEDVDESVDIVNKSSENFSEILEEISNVATQIRDVVRLTGQVSDSSKSVDENFDVVIELSNKTLNSAEGVAESAEQQTAAMEEIASSAMNLATLASELRDSISSFDY